MRFSPLPVSGAFVIELEPHVDERGFFARCFAEEEFARHALDTHFPHVNLSRNIHRATLRGMHYTLGPRVESKVIRCVAGAVHDVVIDLRPDSATFRVWTAVELTAERGDAVYIPAGCAHGFITLSDATDVLYQMGDVFRPEAAAGVRWNDPAFAIDWPLEPRVISARDREYPDFQPS